jgi:TonB family protein
LKLTYPHQPKSGGEESENMNKCLVAVIALVLGVAFWAAQSESMAAESYQVVVDSSTRSKVLNDYTILTRDAIQKNWQRPLDLNNASALKGRVRVDYIVKRSGELDSVELVRGSGIPEMDHSLIEAIRAAQPFPPFPDGVDAAKILIRANFIVADLPTGKVTTASQPVNTEAEDAPQAVPDPGEKKFKWGLPAGTSQAPEPSDQTQDGIPPAPPVKKYRWGVNK